MFRVEIDMGAGGKVILNACTIFSFPFQTPKYLPPTLIESRALSYVQYLAKYVKIMSES